MASLLLAGDDRALNEGACSAGVFVRLIARGDSHRIRLRHIEASIVAMTLITTLKLVSLVSCWFESVFVEP